MRKVFIFIIINVAALNLFSQESIFKLVDWNYYIQIDSSGQRISDYAFEEVDYMRGELTAVRIKEKWGYVDNKGRFKIPLKYKLASHFKNGIAYVSNEEQYFFIDEENKIISEKYDTIYRIKNHYVYEKDDLLGFFDKKLRVIEEPKFDRVDNFYKDKISVKYRGKWMSWSNNILNQLDDDLYFYNPELLPIYNEACKDENRHADWFMSCSYRQVLSATQGKVKYSREAIKNNIQGKIILRFIIDENGEILNPEILRGIGKLCDDEVLRVAHSMKKSYKPASTLSGKAVKMVVTVPVSFHIE